ncbi:uncharacterized protein LOC143141736 [Alosa pseudoharengus]|uniref:uncharacterized protein LOC143141736 n=1 Tax=Alosa pseudoharengus TaxID=34774 RepID=UPI003F8ADDAD
MLLCPSSGPISFPMSSGGGSWGGAEHGRHAPRYDQVSSGSPPRNLRRQRSSELALSADPLPPPPLPDQPPVGLDSGVESAPSDGELAADPALDIKPVHRFIPDSWKNFFRGSNRSSNKLWSMPSNRNNNNAGSNTTSNGVRCSPPHSPSIPGSFRDQYGGSGGSYNSRKEREAMLDAELPESLDGRTVRTAHTGLTYGERVEEYHLRYSYMKSWGGLLRILGCVELLLGAAVFACVCAYIHKDNEWHNMFGFSQPGMYGGSYGGYGGSGYGGYYYTGPKTPFILVVAGLAWLVTVILLVMGMTMYYRTILLDSNWWPLTEFVINLALALLYLAAAIVYVNDTRRGGLCTYPMFNTPINAPFCRVESGQTAGIIFLFVTTLVYLIGAIVCLKLWRHEARRLHREKYGHEMMPRETADGRLPQVVMAGTRGAEPMPISEMSIQAEAAAPAALKPKVVKGHIPSGHIPKPVVMPDYIAKYPGIRTDEERDQYRAVFNDQYAEYKELHADVQVTLKRFDEMDAMMRNLPQHVNSQMEHDRINKILHEYQRKKMDPTFLEKKERCEYLKNKLAHIKQRIQEYDKVMEWNDGYRCDRCDLCSVRLEMSSKPNGSPPPYELENEYNVASQPAYSYYADDEIQHFYRWNSPPGIIKIMSSIGIILCVGIFACVASTLAYDSTNALGGFGGYGGAGYGGTGYAGYGGGTYGGSYGGGGFGGGYNSGGFNYGGIDYNNDPRKGKGFMMAMAILSFLALLIMFIMVISHQRVAQGRKFYLAIIIVSAILAFLMFIATIVYLVAVNPMAQSAGSVQYTQVQALCAQYQQPQQVGMFVNQYLYHYCVVEPEEAIAIVLGFVVTTALIIILVFAVKTRQRINAYGKDNILWRRVKVVEDPNAVGDVEAWVNDMSAVPEPVLNAFPEKFGGSRNYLDEDNSDYKPPYSASPVVAEEIPLRSAAPYSSGSERPSSSGRPKQKRGGRHADGYETDGYMSSGDELDADDFSSEFPPIEYEHDRDEYKRVFDDDHLEYKDLQAELDAINRKMAEVDRELDDLSEGSPQFLDAMDEYNELKNKKKSSDYQLKKKRCKYLKSKLSHIKKMVSDFDRRG